LCSTSKGFLSAWRKLFGLGLQADSSTGERCSQKTRIARVQRQQLPTESQVLEDELRPAVETTDQPAEEMSERHDHGKNFGGKDRIKLCASPSF
jgi:hypothetical protein